MKQVGTSINPANADEFLNSTSSVHHGQMQFLTPFNFAVACLTPLNLIGHTFDPQCGAGDLLHAASHANLAKVVPSRQAEHYGNLQSIGCDIDARASQPPDSKGHFHIAAKIDFPKLFPLLRDVGFIHPQILANPPFSLRWPAKELRSALVDEDLDGLPELLDDHTDKNGNCDSTLWTILANLCLLTAHGESMVICNANTARRFAYDAHGKTTALARFVWLWLEVDAPVFANQSTIFPTGVLYLSTSHGSQDRTPHRLSIQTAEAGEMERLLKPIRDNKWRYHHGHTNYSNPTHQPDQLFLAAVTEYRSQHSNKPQPYNISLDHDGKIRINLSTYARAKFSRTEMDQLKALNALRGAHPAQLVVQVPTRRAMLAAAHGNIWTVDPAALAAIDQACVDYNAVRAPFFRPTPVQCLAYLDEEDSITCTRNGLPGISTGDVLSLSTFTEKVEIPSVKYNLAGEPEKCTLRSQELVCRVVDRNGESHTFHVDPVASSEKNATHKHSVHDLINHFHIPIPMDIAELHPEEHQKHLNTLANLEKRINDESLTLA